MLSYDKEKIEVLSGDGRLSMLPPFTPTSLELKVRSISLKNESIVVHIVHATVSATTTIFLPNCEEFSNE